MYFHFYLHIGPSDVLIAIKPFHASAPTLGSELVGYKVRPLYLSTLYMHGHCLYSIDFILTVASVLFNYTNPFFLKSVDTLPIPFLTL